MAFVRHIACVMVMVFVPKLVLSGPTREQILHNILKNESLKLWPGYTAGEKPLKIQVYFLIEELQELDWTKGTLGIMGTLRTFWFDERIKFSGNFSLEARVSDVIPNLWVPDIIFPNARDVTQHSSLSEDSGVRFRDDGGVYMAMRKTLVLSCPQQLHRFPFDKQQCTVYIEPMLHRIQQVILEWKGAGFAFRNSNGGFNNLVCEGVIKRSTELSYLADGSFETLSLSFKMRRLYGHYVVYWFLPAMLITALMYLLFWLPENTLDAKTFMGSSLLLIFMLLMLGARMDSPKTSYMTALDNWFIVHLFFLFFVILEVIIFHLLQDRTFSKPTAIFHKMGSDHSEDQAAKPCPHSLSPQERLTRKVLWVGRLAFPAVYLLFLAIYWGCYIM